MNDVARPSPSVWRGDLLAAGLTLLWLILIRAAFESPWGFVPVESPEGLRVGIPYNVGDTWSYLSWARQYELGHFAASLLYSTEPHTGWLWIFPLWLDGLLAAATGWPLIGVYSTLGALGAAVAVVCFRRAALTLGFEPSAVSWATFALVLGSGASWLWHCAHQLGMAPPANGAEFFYTDLFPATAFLLHPYHAQSLALLTGLWWAVAAAERRLHRFEDQDRQRESGRDAHAHCAPSATRVAPIQPRTGWKRAGRALATLAPAGGPLSAVALLGALLTFSRPYEPLVFALAYGLKTVCAFLVRHRKPAAWRPTCTVLLVLTFALLPGLLWNAFVSLQPVWSSFAHRSLVQDFPRLGWATAFAGLWILGVFGFAPCWRLPHVAGVLPITAATLCPLLLLTTAHAPAKLASGLALGLAMLAGAGAAATIRALHKRLGGWGTVGAGSLLLAGLFGTPSLAMNLLQVQLNQQATLEPAFTRLAQRLPPETGDRPTVVLTDVSSGEILPGLIGVRVYAGHFSLTVNYDAKRAELRRAGLDPENQPTRDGSTRRKLQTVLDRVAPDYALLDARCVHALEELSSQRWEIVAIEDGWHLLRAPAGTTYPLEK